MMSVDEFLEMDEIFVLFGISTFSILRFFFLMLTIFKVCMEFVKILFLCYALLFWLQGM